MKGLFQGKYLIAVYDDDDFPVFIASTAKEFAEWYCKHHDTVSSITPLSILSHKLRGTRDYSNIHFINADSVTKDCFEEEDQKFINFINETRPKTNKELAAEMGITERRFYYKRRSSGLLKRTYKHKKRQNI